MGSDPLKIAGRVRFGENFELDLLSYELRRAGRVQKLERIPAEILLLLVEQRGQLVTREQIIERIWGKDVFVDTDNSINAAIRKIRQVLKDDPEQPRFLQTVIGRGYRFIAPVIAAESAPAVVPVVLPEVIPEVQPEPVIAEPQILAVEQPLAPPPRRRLLWLSLSILGTVLIAIALSAGYLRWSGSRLRVVNTGQRTMLAVMPFENLTGDAAQEYFSDGMTEEMITQLGSLDPRRVGVIARTSMMHYKHSQKPLQQIARELGVQYVLEGSVRRDPDKVRITAQLIQMRDQTHLWAKQYDREPKDLLAMQNEIAREISDEIQTALGEHKPIASVVQPPLSADAYEAHDFVLKGQYFLNKRTLEGFREAIGYFEQATAKDPSNARAFVGLANAYTLMDAYSGAPAQYTSRARAAAQRALQLDDTLSEAHAALALSVQNHDYDWQTSEREFKRAIELNPNDATAHHWYAEHLTWLGRFDEALRENERARQLDPLSPIIAADNGAILYFARRYDEAIAQFTAVRELDPNFSRTAIIYAAYVQKGMFAEAEADIAKQSTDEGPWLLSTRVYTYGRAGMQAKAEQKLRELLDMNRRHPVDPIVLVFSYVGVGNNDQAIAWLEKAYAQRSNSLTALNVEPVYDPLRGDPRFQNLVRRVGFSQ